MNIDISLKLLADPTLDLGARDDIVMDLAYTDDMRVENLLINMASDVTEEFLQSQIGESIGTIWLRKKYVRSEILTKFTYAAFSSALGMLSHDRSLLDLVRTYVINNNSLSKKIAKDLIEIYLSQFKDSCQAEEFISATYYADSAFELISKTDLNSKLYNYYKLSLAIWLEKDTKIINQIASLSKMNNLAPHDGFEQDAFIYINFVANLICYDSGKAVYYLEKLSKQINNRYPEFSIYIELFNSLDDTSKALQLLNKIENTIITVVRKRSRKINMFNMFHFYLRIIIKYLIQNNFISADLAKEFKHKMVAE